MDPEDACEACEKFISVAHCKTCKEDYCENCLQCHMTFKATKDHKIRRFAQVASSQNEGQVVQPQESIDSSVLEMENDVQADTQNEGQMFQPQTSVDSSVLEMENDVQAERIPSTTDSDLSSKAKAMTLQEEETLGSSLLELEEQSSASYHKADDDTNDGKVFMRKTTESNREIMKTKSCISQSNKPPPVAPKPRLGSLRMPSADTEFQWSLKGLTFQDKVSCTRQNDQKTSKLTGLECLPNGNVVVLDEGNNRLKLYDTAFQYISGVGVPEEAIDLTLASQTSVAVLAGTTIDLFEISPTNTISKMHEIFLAKEDDAVALSFANGYFAVLFALPSRVDVLDIRGSNVKTIELEDIEPGLTLQNSITMTSTGDSFHVSDMNKGRIICFSALGTKLWEHPCRGVVCRTPTSVFLVCDALKEFRELSKEGTLLQRFTTWNSEMTSTECARFHLHSKHLLLVEAFGHEIFRFKIDF